MSLRDCMTHKELLEYRVCLAQGKPRRAAAILFYACLRRFPKADWPELYARCWEYTSREHMRFSRLSYTPKTAATTSAQPAT